MMMALYSISEVMMACVSDMQSKTAINSKGIINKVFLIFFVICTSVYIIAKLIVHAVADTVRPKRIRQQISLVLSLWFSFYREDSEK